MPTSIRQQTRLSLLALITSYLRDGTTDTSNFASYPSAQNVRTFTLNSNLWQLAVVEAGQPVPQTGVAIEFLSDRAEPSKAMPQQWTVLVRFVVSVPKTWVGSSIAQDIAQKVDEALYKSGGRVEIKDWNATPVTTTGRVLQWQQVPRGEWKFDSASGFDIMTLETEMTYSTPSGAGF